MRVFGIYLEGFRPLDGAREVAIEFRSFSKTAGFTGTRCAFAVVPKELHGRSASGEAVSLHALWVRRQSTKFNGVPYVIQRGAAAVYTPEGQKQVRATIDYYMDNARIIREGLESAGLTVHGARNNRRRDARYCASGGAKIQEIGSPAGQWTMIHDISVGGCYVETTTPLLPGAQVDAVVHVGDIQIASRGEITVADRMVGMGVRFTDMTPLHRQRLESLIDQLIQSGAAEA